MAAKANSNTRILVVAVALAIAGYGLYLLNKYLKNLQKPTDTPSVLDTNFDPMGGNYGTTTTTTTKPSTGGVDVDKVFKTGNKGADVKQFQTVLNQIADKTKDAKISADGDFGKKTDALYQKLSLNGSVFQATIKDANRYLGNLSGTNSNTSSYNKFNSNPYDSAQQLAKQLNSAIYQPKCWYQKEVSKNLDCIKIY